MITLVPKWLDIWCLRINLVDTRNSIEVPMVAMIRTQGTHNYKKYDGWGPQRKDVSRLRIKAKKIERLRITRLRIMIQASDLTSQLTNLEISNWEIMRQLRWEKDRIEVNTQ